MLFRSTLAGIYYDNRGMEAPEANVRQLINSFVLELRYAHEDLGETEREHEPL